MKKENNKLGLMIFIMLLLVPAIFAVDSPADKKTAITNSWSKADSLTHDVFMLIEIKGGLAELWNDEAVDADVDLEEIQKKINGIFHNVGLAYPYPDVGRPFSTVPIAIGLAIALAFAGIFIAKKKGMLTKESMKNLGSRLKLKKRTVRQGIEIFKNIHRKMVGEVRSFENLIKRIVLIKRDCIDNVIRAEKIKHMEIPELKSNLGAEIKTKQLDFINEHLTRLDMMYGKIDKLMRTLVHMAAKEMKILEIISGDLIDDIKKFRKKIGKKYLSKEIKQKYGKIDELNIEELRKLRNAIEATKNLNNSLNLFKKDVLKKQLNLINEEKSETELLIRHIRKRDNKGIEESREKIHKYALAIRNVFGLLEENKLPLYVELHKLEKEWIMKAEELIKADEEREKTEEKRIITPKEAKQEEERLKVAK